MAQFNLIISVAIITTVAANVAVIKPCDEVNQSVCTVTEARIEPCSDPKTCILKQGSVASIDFDFIPNFATSKLKTGLYWDNNAVDVPFSDMGSDDGCTYTQCPIEAGKKQTLSYRLSIGKKYPKGTYTIKWKLWNEDDESQLCCFKTTIKIRK